MLNSRELLTDSVLSNTAITEFTAVDYQGNQAATQGMRVAGIAKFGVTAAGQYVTLVTMGTAIMLTGAAIARGQPVICDNQGRAIPANNMAIAAGAAAVTSAAANGANDLTGSDPPEHQIGIALAAAAGAGQFIEVQLCLR
jgi:Uncharacterized conserved protein (DUF2190)